MQNKVTEESSWKIANQLPLLLPMTFVNFNMSNIRWTTKTYTLSDLIEHAVEETWDHREDCWLQGFQIIHQKSNVTLEIADSSPMDEDDTLMKREGCLVLLVQVKLVWHFIHKRAMSDVNMSLHKRLLFKHTAVFYLKVALTVKGSLDIYEWQIHQNNWEGHEVDQHMQWHVWCHFITAHTVFHFL